MNTLTSDFTTDRNNKLLIAEVSDFNDSTGGRVPYDVCVLSTRTNRRAVFFRVDDIRPGSDDTVLVYEPTMDTLAAIPELEGWSIRLLND